jgi:hypothetical protein
MANAYTPHSVQARQVNAERWTKEQVASGSKRLFVLLPPEAVEQLERITAIYGTKTAAICTAIAELDKRTRR